ncbi:MAG: helix-turn-helix domain-containing protein [Actinomycetota bacterium]
MIPQHDTDRPGADTTKARLEEAALELFARDGYEAVTASQIAAAAGVTERTFFRHFSTKLASLLGDSDERAERFTELLRAQPPGLDPLEALLAAIAAEEADHPTSPDDLLRRRIILATPSLADDVRAFESSFERTIAEWLGERTGRGAEDYEVAVIAAALVACRRVVVNTWDASGGTESLVDLAARALAAIEVRL